VLTNSHNLACDPVRCTVWLGERGEHRAPVVSTVLDRPARDYALLAVQLPRGMNTVPPARISRAGSLSRAVYAVGGGAGDEPVARPVRRGQLRNRGQLRVVDPLDGRPAVNSLRYSYRSGDGFSGAGVFSARTGALEALHWGNSQLFGSPLFERAHAVPLDTILADARQHLGGISSRKARAAVERLSRPTELGSNPSTQGGVK
jgi:hypothetical protein